MTRASAGMPYDSDAGSSEELALLFSRLKQAFEARLKTARDGPVYEEELSTFASLCVERHIPCVTFNYDDLLDEALWKVKSIADYAQGRFHWHPDGGYGFFCGPAWALPGSAQRVRMDDVAMFLLKLHGSVNWRIRLGHPSPLPADAVVHLEPWLPRIGSSEPGMPEIQRHLEPRPLLVPPILGKDVLLDEPFLRLVWSRAYQALQEADLVVFVGYSLPVTDIAARFLFSEAIQPDARVRVVNYARSKTQEAQLRANYRLALPDLRYDQFSFEGALDWSRNLAEKYL